MFKTKKALPFHDKSTLFLSWISMLMVFIASLALFGSISLTNIIQTWNRAVSGSLTIQIPSYDISGVSRKEEMQQDIEKTMALLNSWQGVTEASVLSDTQMSALMEPWLGVMDKIEEMPLPKLIDVQLQQNFSFDFDGFKQTLNEQVPLAMVDSHRLWLAHLIETAHGIQNMIAFILILLILTTSFTVIYTTLSSLALQGSVLKLLHMMGARDFSIAFQYACRNLMKSFIGGCVGFFLSLPIVWIVTSLVNPLRDPLFSAGSFTPTQWAIVLSVPVLAALLSFFTALFTVIKTLKASV